MIGIVLSITMGIYFNNEWFGIWFLFSVALGNVAGEEDGKYEKVKEEEKKKHALSFNEFVVWNTFYKPEKSYREDNTKYRKVLYHYPKEKGNGADVRTHEYVYTDEDIYEIHRKHLIKEEFITANKGTKREQ